MLYKLFPIKFHKWTTLLGGFLIQLSIGSFLTFGNMVPYITSYLRESVHINIRYSNSVWIATAYNFAFSISILLSGLITSYLKLNTKLSILLGSALLSLSTILTHFTIQKSFFLVVLTYGILFGIGSGFAYSGPISLAIKWFPNKSGLSVSAILFGYGASSILFDQIQTMYINPGNLSPDKPFSSSFPDEKYFSNPELLARVPKIFLILGGVYALLQVVGVGLLAERKDDPSVQINDFCEETELIKSEKMNSLGVRYEDSTEGLSLNEAWKYAAFWMLFCKIFSQLVPCGLVITYYKTFGQRFISDDQFLSQVGSIAAFFNAFGTFFWGFVIDRSIYKICFVSLSTVLISLTSTLYLVQYLNFRILYAVCVGLINMCQSGVYVIMPTVIVKSFGSKNFQAIYGLLFLSPLFSSLMVGILGSSSDKIGWFWVFIICALIALLGWILGFVFNVRKSDGTEI
ncbi:oxalate:formate antiporter-like isoform X1 [Brachionus plicatilis]|uniref:Oxalate:formate antiporter-like isoform X1 n=1 Tax=Brachionus plicatilis TaxID=10195 RepID=A0A3M7RND2_BRAPC|nr:oxalate:formate antiporter-like isoform X1 [Brachionus plicatilis]